MALLPAPEKQIGLDTSMTLSERGSLPLLALALSLNQFRNKLVVVRNPPQDNFAFFVLQALSDAENFPGVEAPVLGVVSELGGHCCHGGNWTPGGLSSPGAK